MQQKDCAGHWMQAHDRGSGEGMPCVVVRRGGLSDVGGRRLLAARGGTNVSRCHHTDLLRA